jgi:hypothetical protein
MMLKFSLGVLTVLELAPPEPVGVAAGRGYDHLARP